MALVLLTISSLPEPPSIVCLEEPDRGLHPRLLRDVRDAVYRLAYPEGAHDKREPVQVIATTHNPYFLDLFREHPEEIVIAEKVGLDATFSRLSDRSDLEEILGDAMLSEVWYSGVLGGVPAGT
jgi:predicted ATPase